MKLVTSPKEIEHIIDEIRLKPKPVKLGFTGVPPHGLWKRALEISDEVIDLDMPVASNPVSLADKYLPKVTCATLRTIVANIISMPDLDWVILSSGIDKCDGARFIGLMISGQLKVPVILTENLNMIRKGNPICESSIPLRNKFQLIVDGIIKPYNGLNLNKSTPDFGFWGVPPNDFDILDLFPDNTHVFGWARCIENGVPSDIGLEEYAEPDLPTVYFAQAFCPKNVTAYRLAKKNHGLYVELDSKLDRSIKAKIEAFLWLSSQNR